MIRRPILIYDENTTDSQGLTDAIKNIDPLFEIKSTSSKTEALELVSSKGPSTPAIIFIDVVAENGSGLELIQTLKADESFKIIPIIVVSRKIDAETVHDCFKNGVAGFMPKPNEQDEYVDLATKIISYWNKSQLPTSIY